MSCIDPPHISIGDIPGLSLLLGDISISLPDLSLNLCCNFDIPLPSISIPLGSIIGTLTISTSGSAVDTVLLVIDTIIATINSLLDLLSFDCPLS